MSAKQDSGLGLDDIGDLSNFLEGGSSDGKPLMLNVDIIDADPNQPRKANNPGFSKESIRELAADIKFRGVKSPISVRPNPDKPGRYLINHGERRWLATKQSGKEQIPSFIDEDYTDDDQVVENIHRNDLTPREIADHIGRKLSQGKKKGEIAKALGVSAAFISQHVTLLDLPDAIAAAFNEGRIRDVTVVNELVKAHKSHPQEVEQLLEDNAEDDITRSSVKLFREYLEDKENSRDPNTIDAFTDKTDSESKDDDSDNNEGYEDKNDVTDSTRKQQEKETDPDKFKKAIVIVEYLGEQGRILLNRRPSEEGLAWIKFEHNGTEEELNLENVKLVCLMEG